MDKLDIYKTTKIFLYKYCKMIIVHNTWSPDWCLPSAVNLILNLSDVGWNPDNDDMMTQQNKIIQKTFEVIDLNST